MKKNDDIHYMQRALDLARKGMGRTNPNPMVGAVIVKNGQIIAEGYHKKAGTPHAEIHALNAAGQDALFSTIYVSLEPCSHHGRTPPCADALVNAGIKRAVIASLDPNPQVSGRGLKILQDAGIETEVGVLEKEALKLNEVFFKYITSKRPFISLKTAVTLDGKIASWNGDSRWISNPASRKYVHNLRNVYDGIMVGIGTVLADDPMLNTRLDIDDKRDPLRIIIDGDLELPLESKIVKSSREQKTLVFTSRINNHSKAAQLQDAGIEIIELGGNPQKLAVKKALEILGEREVCSILLEGGAELNAYMIEHKLINKVYWFIAPKIIGGRNSPSPIAGQGIELMDNALCLHNVDMQRIQDDILITAYTGW
jgi:diaminohydroxyphosphoribosylaminopyrimidine deaminase/5-amino-6-(5-phosphoribosylamino)uracil reductase